MKVLLHGHVDGGERERWSSALAQAMPEAEWLDLTGALAQADAVTAAVVALPRPGELRALPRLRLIQSLWAGVEKLLADATLPTGVPIARMVDPSMNAAMAETALWATLALHRGFFIYARRQRQGQWQQHAQRRADEVGVLVLGMGEMGRAAATAIARAGYTVTGWSRSGLAAVDGVARIAGDAELRAALPHAQVLINLLPLTPATRGLLDARLFASLPAGAGVANLARGAHVVDDDLLAALDGGRISHAVLDVFQQEPLPPGHRFWHHGSVTVLPHAAALTDPRTAAAVVARNLRALRDGGPVAHLVDRGRGY